MSKPRREGTDEHLIALAELTGKHASLEQQAEMVRAEVGVRATLASMFTQRWQEGVASAVLVRGG